MKSFTDTLPEAPGEATIEVSISAEWGYELWSISLARNAYSCVRSIFRRSPRVRRGRVSADPWWTTGASFLARAEVVAFFVSGRRGHLELARAAEDLLAALGERLDHPE